MSIDAQVEKEIVIDLQEEIQEEKTSENNNENNNENVILENTTKEESQDESPEKPPNKFIEKKPITKLTEDERAFIIANAKAGVDQPYFNVKFFKNGKAQITKKKETPQTVSSKITTQMPPPKKEQQVYYTDNQLLFEHIIELNAKVEKLMHKQKKLKRRYQTLQDDIYVDDSEDAQPLASQESASQPTIPQEKNSQNENISEPEVVPQPPPQNVNIKRNVRSVKNGWRSQIAFL